jgi:hypothetical protein
LTYHLNEIRKDKFQEQENYFKVMTAIVNPEMYRQVYGTITSKPSRTVIAESIDGTRMYDDTESSGELVGGVMYEDVTIDDLQDPEMQEMIANLFKPQEITEEDVQRLTMDTDLMEWR